MDFDYKHSYYNKYDGKSMMYENSASHDFQYFNEYNNQKFDTIVENKQRSNRDKAIYGVKNLIYTKKIETKLTPKTILNADKYNKYQFTHNIKNRYVIFSILEPIEDSTHTMYMGYNIIINNKPYHFTNELTEIKMYFDDKSDTFDSIEFNYNYEIKNIMMYITDMKHAIIYNDLPVYMINDLIIYDDCINITNKNINFKSKQLVNYSHRRNKERKRKNYNKFKNINSNRSLKNINYIYMEGDED
jgi:hypothetical protein